MGRSSFPLFLSHLINPWMDEGSRVPVTVILQKQEGYRWLTAPFAPPWEYMATGSMELPFPFLGLERLVGAPSEAHNSSQNGVCYYTTHLIRCPRLEGEGRVIPLKLLPHRPQGSSWVSLHTPHPLALLSLRF